jgi:hypothetical protein
LFQLKVLAKHQIIKWFMQSTPKHHDPTLTDLRERQLDRFGKHRKAHKFVHSNNIPFGTDVASRYASDAFDQTDGPYCQDCFE